MSALYPFEPSITPRRGATDLNTDFRARVALEKAERDEKRRLEQEEQRSETSSPRVRVLAWEKAHGLRMPSDAEHPILYVIARATRLPLEEVRKEQQARAVVQQPV
jgi:hypothetical protein